LATFFYNEKNYKKAAATLPKQISMPFLLQNRHSSFRWGYSLFSQKALKDALDQFNYIKLLGGQYGPAASYYAGFVEFSLGDYANALTDLSAQNSGGLCHHRPYLIANVYYKQKD